MPTQKIINNIQNTVANLSRGKTIEILNEIIDELNYMIDELELEEEDE